MLSLLPDSEQDHPGLTSSGGDKEIVQGSFSLSFFFVPHLLFRPPTPLLPCTHPTATCILSALPSCHTVCHTVCIPSCSSSVGFCKPFDQLCADIHNMSPTPAATSAINRCQRNEASASLCLLVSSWFASDDTNNDAAAAPTLTCSASRISPIVSSHDGHRLA